MWGIRREGREWWAYRVNSENFRIEEMCGGFKSQTSARRWAEGEV